VTPFPNLSAQNIKTFKIAFLSDHMANINPLELVGHLPMHTVEMQLPLDNVSLWLQECGLGEYVQVFKTAGYDDINLIKILNEEDLDAMGIDKPGTRKKILMYADQLKQITEPQLHHTPIVEQRVPVQHSPKPKGNSRANPYRCTKCCEFKIRSLDGKAHQCKPELVGHSWDACPTQNIRQHPEERQRRKQDQKMNKGNRSRKRKATAKSDTSPDSSPETVTAWEYHDTGDHYQTQEGSGYAGDFGDDRHIFGFDGPPHKRMKIDISQQVADVSAHVMENYITDEIAKQLGGSIDVDTRSAHLQADDLSNIDF